VLLLVFTGVASTILHKPYGDAMTASIGRLAVTACVLLLAWRLDWLKALGISRLGSWQVWLLALGGLVYAASASLYSFYGRVAFDFSSLLRLPDARTAVTTHFLAGLSMGFWLTGNFSGSTSCWACWRSACWLSGNAFLGNLPSKLLYMQSLRR
jgi:hypothetical protein